MSLTVGAFGVILSITASAVLGTNISSPEIQLTVAIGGGIALYGLWHSNSWFNYDFIPPTGDSTN